MFANTTSFFVVVFFILVHTKTSSRDKRERTVEVLGVRRRPWSMSRQMEKTWRVHAVFRWPLAVSSFLFFSPAAQSEQAAYMAKVSLSNPSQISLNKPIG